MWKASFGVQSKRDILSHAETQLDEKCAHRPGGPQGRGETFSMMNTDVDDIVIAVVGSTGSGKSTFICSASGRDTNGVGHTLRPSTNEVTSIKFWDKATKRQVVLVDTPGFDSMTKSDLGVLMLISKWLSHNRVKFLSAVVYLHRITDNRMTNVPFQHLQALQKLCGKGTLDTIYLTTTMWDEVDPDMGERRLDELKMETWKTLIEEGAQMARCRSDDNSAKRLLQQIILRENLKNFYSQSELRTLRASIRTGPNTEDTKISQVICSEKPDENIVCGRMPTPLTPLDLTPYIIKTKDSYIAGGFADVHRCWCQVDGYPKQVAVKALRFKFALDGDDGDRSGKMFRRELGIWRRLGHHNIVPFLGIARGFGMRGAISLVSLWMPHESIRDFLEKYNDSLGIGHRLQFLLDIANGLQYLHSFPIIHGDLNCNNVLIDEDCTARLSDFGYASLIGNIPEALTYLQRNTDRPGALRWIAPEQLESEETSGKTTKSDIYSFGCVALQVLSGMPPWSEVRQDAAIVLRLARGHKPGRPASETLLDVHWNFILECWSRMEERPTAEAIVPRVQRFLSDHPESQRLQDLVSFWSSQTDSQMDELLPAAPMPISVG